MSDCENCRIEGAVREFGLTGPRVSETQEITRSVEKREQRCAIGASCVFVHVGGGA